MTIQNRTSSEIVQAVYGLLYQDESLVGQLGNLPYISVHALPPGQFDGGANWRLDIAVCSSPEMHAAVLRAMETVQQQMWLLTPPISTSSTG